MGALGIVAVDHTWEKIMDKTNIDIIGLAKSHQIKEAFDQASSRIKENASGPVYESIQGQSILLKRISPDGTIKIGTFEKGVFKELESNHDSI